MGFGILEKSIEFWGNGKGFLEMECRVLFRMDFANVRERATMEEREVARDRDGERK